MTDAQDRRLWTQSHATRMSRPCVDFDNVLTFRSTDLLLEQRDPHSDSEEWHGWARSDGLQEAEDPLGPDDASSHQGLHQFRQNRSLLDVDHSLGATG